MTDLPDTDALGLVAFIDGKLRDVRRGPYRLVKSGGLVGRQYWVRCIDRRHKPGSDDRIVFDMPVGWSRTHRSRAVNRLQQLPMPDDRFTVCDVQVGANGLAARPAVYDTTTGRTVKVYRTNQRDVAARHAATLNAGDTGKEEPVTTETATPDAPATDAKPAKGKATKDARLRSPLGVCPGTGQAPSKALGTRAVPKSKQRYTGAENGPWGECPVCGHAKPLAKDGGTVVRHRITEAVATKLGTKVLPKQRTGRPAAAKPAASKGKTKATKAKAASKPQAKPSGKPQPKPRSAKAKPRAAVGEKSRRGPKSLSDMLTLRQ